MTKIGQNQPVYQARANLYIFKHESNTCSSTWRRVMRTNVHDPAERQLINLIHAVRYYAGHSTNVARGRSDTSGLLPLQVALYASINNIKLFKIIICENLQKWHEKIQLDLRRMP
jgi:hypothetical protein